MATLSLDPALVLAASPPPACLSLSVAPTVRRDTRALRRSRLPPLRLPAASPPSHFHGSLASDRNSLLNGYKFINSSHMKGAIGIWIRCVLLSFFPPLLPSLPSSSSLLLFSHVLQKEEKINLLIRKKTEDNLTDCPNSPFLMEDQWIFEGRIKENKNTKAQEETRGKESKKEKEKREREEEKPPWIWMRRLFAFRGKFSHLKKKPVD